MQMCLYIFFMTQRDFAQFARLLLCQHLQAVYMYTNMILASVFFPYVFLSHPPSLSLSLSIFLSLSLSLSLSCSLSLSLYLCIHLFIYLSIYLHTTGRHFCPNSWFLRRFPPNYCPQPHINESRTSTSTTHPRIYQSIHSHTFTSHQSVESISE